MNITIEELKKLEKGTYQIIDIRDENEVAHGAIPGAVVCKNKFFGSIIFVSI